MSKTVAVYNNKGGVGKTTIATHIAFRAAGYRIKTLAVGIDPQGDMFEMISGGDKPKPDGATFDHSDALTCLFSPNNFPRVPNTSLVVCDCPPAINTALAAKPDLWLVPVDGRLSMTDLGNVLGDLQDAGGDIWVVINKLDSAGKRVMNAAKSAASKLPGVTVWPNPIPDSAAIKRTGEYLRPIWNVPYGEGSDAEAALLDLCDAVLVQLGLLRRR